MFTPLISIVFGFIFLFVFGEYFCFSGRTDSRGDAPWHASADNRFPHLQRYNPQPPLSRFFRNFFLAGLQYDAEKLLTNRGGIVNFREGISRVLPGIFFSLGSPVQDHPLPPPKRRGFRGARYSRWIVLARVARFFRGEPIAGAEPVPAHAHSFPHVLPTSPTQSPGHGTIPLLQEGCPKGGVVAPARGNAASSPRPLAAPPRALPLLPLLTPFNHRNPLHHSKIQKRATLYIKLV